MYNVHSSSKPTRLILLLLATIAGLANAEGRTTDVASGQYELQSGELARSYLLHETKQLTHPAPLVIIMYGSTGSADSSMSCSAMNDVADEEGFGVVYPQGTVDQQGNAFSLKPTKKQFG